MAKVSDSPEQRLKALNLTLPSISPGKLLGFKIDQGSVYVSGQLPRDNGKLSYLGKVGDSISRETAYEAAKLAGLNVLAQLSLATDGRLSKICEIVKVSGYVNCAPDFIDIPYVINGASDLFVSVFGKSGTHARIAIGVASLPSGTPVEIEAIARIREDK